MILKNEISDLSLKVNKVQRNYLLISSSFITFIHLIQVLNFILQDFILLSIVNIISIFLNFYINWSYKKNKNINESIKFIITFESIMIFIHILFIWKVYPEVFIWSGCVIVAILLFFENKELIKYLSFSILLFVAAPSLSIMFGLSEYFDSNAIKSIFFYKQILYLNIIGAILLLTFITLSYKKYIYVNNLYLKRIQNYNETISTKDILTSDVNDGNKVDLKKLFFKIKQYIEQEKKYLDSDYNLKKLSIEIGSNVSYVSKSINTYSGYNFNDYINKYRVEYFKQLVENNYEDIYMIKRNYIKCGFKQQSTFNRVFKQFEEMTPTEFIDKLA